MSTPSCKADVVSELLSRLAGTLHGLADTGTAMCAGTPGEMPDGFLDRFITRRERVVQSLLILIPEFLGTTAYQEPIKSHLRDLDVSCRSFMAAMRKLFGFRQLDPAGLREATS